MSSTPPKNFQIVHDQSHSEDVTGNRYLVAKVYEDSVEVAQVKLEVHDNGGSPTLAVTTTGHLAFDTAKPDQIAVDPHDPHPRTYGDQEERSKFLYTL